MKSYSFQFPEEKKIDLLKTVAGSSPYATAQDSRQLLPSIVQLLKVYVWYLVVWKSNFIRKIIIYFLLELFSNLFFLLQSLLYDTPFLLLLHTVFSENFNYIYSYISLFCFP